MADRLSIDNKHIEKLIKTDIDGKDMLYFKSDGERIDLFMFALALGVNEGKRTPSKAKKGFIQESAAKGKELAMSFVYSLALDELRKEGKENQITDKKTVYTIAEEYANTGFNRIKELVPDFSKYTHENLVDKLVEIMNEKYQQIKEEDKI